MNRFCTSLSLVALCASTSGVAQAQNTIDFRVKVSGASTKDFFGSSTDEQRSYQMHDIHIRFDTDAPPIGQNLFEAEIISWEFWDNALVNHEIATDLQPPFSTDGSPTLNMVNSESLIAPQVFMYATNFEWRFVLSGSLPDGGYNDTLNSSVFCEFQINYAPPEFNTSIETLPDDPALYTTTNPNEEQAVEFVAYIGGFETIAEWPPLAPEPDPFFYRGIGSFAWSAELTTQDECFADLNNDGNLDFFDISSYITLFTNGCP